MFRKKLSVLLTLLCAGWQSIGYGQTALWPGKTHKVEVNVSSGEFGPSWTTDNPTLRLEGSGFYRNITATAYFGGTATVTCTYKYRLGNSEYTRYKSWNFTCNATDVSVSPASVTLAPNETYQLSWNFNRMTYLNPVMQFTSGNYSVASVSETGIITAKSPGSTAIYVRSNIGTNSAMCNVTVKRVETQSISLPASKTLIIGQSITLVPVVVPGNISTSLTWSSNNTSVASVSSSGLVNGVSVGTAVITVRTSEGITASCSVTVENTPIAPQTISLPTSKFMSEGDSFELIPILTPEGARTTFKWESSDESIVEVDAQGILIAKSQGAATVTVTTDNNLTAVCDITVEKSETGISQNVLKVKINRIDRLIRQTLKQN